MISRIAMIAAAGLLLGAAMTPANAADLGGGCCADLEERVAELEATTARKGNRVVSLQIYGTVAKGLLVVDNGDDSDTFVVDNDAITSILGFKGEATVKPGVKAGFNIELNVADASSGAVDFGDDEGGNNGTISLRKSFLYIESEKFGRVSIGQQSTAADGVTAVSLGNTLVSGSPDHGFGITVGGGTGLKTGDFAQDFDAGRDDVIRYDSPSIYGFIVSAAWGDNDYYDVAVRFAKEWNSIKIAAAAGYQKSDNDDLLGVGKFEALTGSVSVMHVPTGLFAALMLGEKELDSGQDASFWYLQGGIERKWLSYGATTLYGEYGQYTDVATLSLDDDDGAIVSAANSSEAERFGFGVVQHFDSAALDLYAQATFWNFEADGVEQEDMTTVMVGAKIDF